MSKQKGQGVIEFALVLPLLMLIIMGMCYFGMVFADYLMMNNLARSAAHEAANTDGLTSELDSIEEKYNRDDAKYMPFDFFTVDVDVKPYDNNNVEVDVNYHLSDGTWLAKIMTNLIGSPSFREDKKPIRYIMYNPKMGSSSSK